MEQFIATTLHLVFYSTSTRHTQLVQKYVVAAVGRLYFWLWNDLRAITLEFT